MVDDTNKQAEMLHAEDVSYAKVGTPVWHGDWKQNYGGVSEIRPFVVEIEGKFLAGMEVSIEGDEPYRSGTKSAESFDDAKRIALEVARKEILGPDYFPEHVDRVPDEGTVVWQGKWEWHHTGGAEIRPLVVEIEGKFLAAMQVSIAGEEPYRDGIEFVQSSDDAKRIAIQEARKEILGSKAFAEHGDAHATQDQMERVEKLELRGAGTDQREVDQVIEKTQVVDRDGHLLAEDLQDRKGLITPSTTGEAMAEARDRTAAAHQRGETPAPAPKEIHTLEARPGLQARAASEPLSGPAVAATPASPYALGKSNASKIGPVPARTAQLEASATPKSASRKL